MPVVDEGQLALRVQICWATTPPDDGSRWLWTQLSLYTARCPAGKLTRAEAPPVLGSPGCGGLPPSTQQSLPWNTPGRNPPGAPPIATRWRQSTAPGGGGVRRERPRGVTNRHPSPTAGRHQPPPITNRQAPPSARRHQQPGVTNCRPLPTAGHHQLPPVTNRQLLPMPSRYQPPAATNCRPLPTAGHHQAPGVSSLAHGCLGRAPVQPGRCAEASPAQRGRRPHVHPLSSSLAELPMTVVLLLLLLLQKKCPEFHSPPSWRQVQIPLLLLCLDQGFQNGRITHTSQSNEHLQAEFWPPTVCN